MSEESNFDPDAEDETENLGTLEHALQGVRDAVVEGGVGNMRLEKIRNACTHLHRCVQSLPKDSGRPTLAHLWAILQGDTDLAGKCMVRAVESKKVWGFHLINIYICKIGESQYFPVGDIYYHTSWDMRTLTNYALHWVTEIRMFEMTEVSVKQIVLSNKNSLMVYYRTMKSNAVHDDEHLGDDGESD